jgi:large-conductance mechanosensitive channel
LPQFSGLQWRGLMFGKFIIDFIQFLFVLLIVFLMVRYVLKFFKLVEDKKEKEVKKITNDE